MARCVRIFSPAKINLFLEVGPKRKDGFHDIVTLMLRLAWGDFVEAGLGDPPGEAEGYRVFPIHKRFTLCLAFEAGYPLSCRRILLAEPQNNLVVRAWHELASRFPKYFRKPAWIALEKAVPTGAGLGGGSSNAASALLAFKGLFKPPLPACALERLGAGLGSDVPFFLRSSARRPLWWAAGRGEKLRPVGGRFPWHLLVIYPGFGVATRWAYDALDQKGGSLLRGQPSSLTTPTILPRLLLKPADLMRNRFESVVFRRYPVLAKAKELLLNSRAEAVALTGSGSSLIAVSADAERCRSWIRMLKADKRFSGFRYYITVADGSANSRR